MDIGTIFALLPVLLRVLHEAPALLAEVEAFWNKVTAGGSVPAHVDAAVQAAFVKMHEGEVG